MKDLREISAQLLAQVRTTAPLVHNITNFVAMNSSANILLAAGASPVMAHAPQEVADMAALAGALVLNIGTLEEDWLAAMVMAGQAANRKGIPVILDPVGAGATPYRTAAVQRILREVRVAVIRGNASEIAALVVASTTTRGVDSALAVSEVAQHAVALACQQSCIVAVSGPEDLVTDGNTSYRIANGHPLMTKVTGLGCGLSAVVGAFCAVGQVDLLVATAAACGYYGVCGETAAARAAQPGSFAVAFIDALAALAPDELLRQLEFAAQ